MKEVTPEVLRQLLLYDRETGDLEWRPRNVEWFNDGSRPAEHTCKIWNSRHANTIAFTVRETNGYKTGRVFGRTYKAHRVAFAIHHGHWPVNQIDHINGNRADNRIANLRDVTPTENMRNIKLASNNTSGVTGISLHNATGKWRAYIDVNNRNIHLGSFTSIDEAIKARREAEIKYGFHPNHGRTDDDRT